MNGFRIYTGELPAAAQEAVQHFKEAGVLVTAAWAEAELAVYPAAEQALCRQAPAGQIRLLESPLLPADLTGADILLPEGIPAAFLAHALRHAIRLVQQQRDIQHLQQQLDQQQQQSERLMDIGMALSAEQDHAQLLDKILQEARRFASCDAASIFLIEDNAGEPELVFKLSQNDSVALPFEEQRFPLDSASLAGFAAQTGQILNFADVYHLPPAAPYRFNQGFDRQTGYRTRSMLVIPMRTHDGRINGVIQFINRKQQPQQRLTSAALAEQWTLPFDAPLVRLLETLSSQAAVAIENNLLLERINLLFEGFVRASVHAIEQRDPTTSGHSFRVAELTIALAEAAHEQRQGALAAVRFSPAQLRELRYAALLHDFGKVGVREHVLVKAKKLSPEAWLRFQYRIALQQERVTNHFLQQRLEAARRQQLSSELEERLAVAEQQAQARLQDMRQAVELANEPSILDEGTFEHLQHMREQLFQDLGGESRPLLDDVDFLALAVRRGSLTHDERREIESHVTHTIRFLSTIPWTPELAHVPHIAGAHHEKMDGSGYPHHLCGDDIPVGARMMTVCDIFDALTATDRPYKAAMPWQSALDVLHSEANNGKIDTALVQLFSRLPLPQLLPTLKSL